jgi:hypothetical protein
VQLQIGSEPRCYRGGLVMRIAQEDSQWIAPEESLLLT